MGNCAVIKVYQNLSRRDKNPPVFLYTHWNGDEIYGYLKRALSRRERWDDVSYLTRMIFCEMVKGCEADSTGYGISTFQPDSDHTILGVDTVKQEVSFEDRNGNVKSKITFDQFVDRKDKWSE
jgi:hypothetical protein